MGGLPDPDWYLDNVLVHARPGSGRLASLGPAAEWLRWWAARSAPLPVLAELLPVQGFVVTVAQLRAAGVTKQRASTRLRREEYYRAARGVIAPLDLRDDDAFLTLRRRHAASATAAVLGRDDHVVSGRSAAVLHGLPVLALPVAPEVTDRRQNGLGRHVTSHVHGATTDDADIGTWFGAPVLTAARTLVDLARHDRRDGIMAADAALREAIVTRREIDAALQQAVGWPGVRQARHVLALADPRAESPLESVARLVLHEDGFPPPQLQVVLGGDRVDMLFDEERLILEIDGLDKYRFTTLAEEKRRERRLRSHGYRVERLTWNEIVREWPRTRWWLRPLFGLPV